MVANINYSQQALNIRNYSQQTQIVNLLKAQLLQTEDKKLEIPFEQLDTEVDKYRLHIDTDWVKKHHNITLRLKRRL